MINKYLKDHSLKEKFVKSGNGNFYIDDVNVTKETYERELRWHTIESKLDKVLDEITRLKKHD